MSKNRDQMIARVLTKLGHNQPGQTISVEDKQIVDDLMEPIFAELSARQIFYVADYDSYDDESFEALADFLAAGLWQDFAKDKPAADIQRADAINRLELIAAPSGTGQPLSTDPILRAGAYRPGTYTGNG